MAILRNPNRDRWTVLANDAPNDGELSVEGLGLYTYLMSKPDGWRIIPNELKKRFGIGRKKLQRIFKHLTTLSYLELRYTRGEDGHLSGTEYVLHEVPHREAQNGSLGTEIPQKASLGKVRDSTNGTALVNTDVSGSTKKDNKNGVSLQMIDELPDWLDHGEWGAFVEHRKAMKAKMTGEAAKRIIKKLDRFRRSGHDPNEILSTSIENGWKGVFEPKRDKQARFNGGEHDGPRTPMFK